MRFLSDLVLLPGREASDQQEFDTPQSLGLKLKQQEASVSLVTSRCDCEAVENQPSQTFQSEL